MTNTEHPKYKIGSKWHDKIYPERSPRIVARYEHGLVYMQDGGFASPDSWGPHLTPYVEPSSEVIYLPLKVGDVRQKGDQFLVVDKWLETKQPGQVISRDCADCRRPYRALQPGEVWQAGDLCRESNKNEWKKVTNLHGHQPHERGWEGLRPLYLDSAKPKHRMGGTRTAHAALYGSDLQVNAAINETLNKFDPIISGNFDRFEHIKLDPPKRYESDRAKAVHKYGPEVIAELERSNKPLTHYTDNEEELLELL